MIKTTEMKNASRTHTGRMLATVLVGAAGLWLGGCNSSNTALLEANRALTDRNTALTQENESLTKLVQQLQGAVTARDRALEEQNRLIADLRAGKSGLEGQIADLGNRLSGLNFGALSVLDASTDQALRELAAQHSDLLEYDASRGLLRFKSDLTFDSGSDVVRPAAKSTLGQLAQILNSSAAQYDVRVVGHTDAQRLSAGTAQRHSTNIRLSCDRAISVRNVLGSGGVALGRLEVAGWGELDPMVPNSANGNTPANRRVEIFLVKPRTKIGVTPAGDTAPAPAARPAPAPTKSSSDEIMK